MLSSYTGVEVKKLSKRVDVYTRDFRNKGIIGEGFEFVWKCQNKERDWYCSLIPGNSLPAMLDVSSDFSTTIQIKRYK